MLRSECASRVVAAVDGRYSSSSVTTGPHTAHARPLSFRSAVAMTSSRGRKWRRKSVYDVIVAALLQMLSLATALSDLPDAEPMPADFTGKSFRR